MSIIRASEYFKNRSVNYPNVYRDIRSILDTYERYDDGFAFHTYSLLEFYEEAYLKIPEYCIGASTFEKCLDDLAKKMPCGESKDGKPSVPFLIMAQMLFTIAHKVQNRVHGDHVAKNRQLMIMAENAAKKLAYKFLPEGDVFVASAIDPFAEAVAAVASSEESTAIYDYLTSLTDSEKENALKGLVLLAGSVANEAKKKSAKTASGLSEYLQLIRHPEKKDDPSFAAFFEKGHLRKELYSDIFAVCIYYLSSAKAGEVYDKLSSLKQ